MPSLGRSCAASERFWADFDDQIRVDSCQSWTNSTKLAVVLTNFRPGSPTSGRVRLIWGKLRPNSGILRPTLGNSGVTCLRNLDHCGPTSSGIRSALGLVRPNLCRLRSNLRCSRPTRESLLVLLDRFGRSGHWPLQDAFRVNSAAPWWRES